jgi:hypothetical protein
MHERPAAGFDRNQAWSIKTSTINLTEAGSISITKHSFSATGLCRVRRCTTALSPQEER